MSLFRSRSMRAAQVAAFTALGALSALPGRAQSLIHRYSFNGNANDSVGSANGVAVGSVSFATAPGVNGSALFTGGTTASNPGYVSLPTSAVSGLQNATVEIFTTNFNMPKDQTGPGGPFQALFAAASAAPSTANYVVLCANRAGSGLGTGAGANGTSQVVAGHDPLPVSVANHVIDLVYSGFTGIGSVGTETVYVDGVQVAQGPTVFSFADVAAGSSGIGTVGIGGGSPFNDPTFSGSMNEVRIFSDALTPTQVAAEVVAGPSVLAVLPGTALTVTSARGFAGQTLTLTAALAGTATGTAQSGKTLTFLVDGASVGTAVTNGNGLASLSYVLPAGLTPGIHALGAAFAGDSGAAASSVAGTLLVLSNTALSVASLPGAYGQTVTLTATLTRTTDGAALSGRTVGFAVGGVQAGTAITSAAGVATLTYVVPNGLTLGAHPVAASFADNGGYLACSGTGTLTVAKAGTSLTVPAASGARGATVTLRATLQRATDGALMANRSVTFTVDGKAAGMAVTNASGVASRSYTAPAGSAAGGHPVSAGYAGDGTTLAGTGTGTLRIN